MRENLHVQGYLQFWDDLLAAIQACGSIHAQAVDAATI